MIAPRTTGWLVAIAAGLAATGAGAQPRRYTRKPAAPPTAGRAAATATRPRAAPLPPGPTATPDDLLAAQGKAMKIRRAQIDLLEGEIADCEQDRTCPETDLADYRFREAELYALEQRYYKLETQRLAIAADHAAPGGRAALETESRAAAAAAKRSLVDAIKVYKALVDDDRFATYANLPKAMFYYAYSLGAGGYGKEMRAIYERLLREYPQSPYAPEAHLAFADYHFAENQLADAESRYERVIQFPKSSVYWYARYKLGWVQWNLGKADDALGTFHAVAIGTAKDPARQELHRAAENDLVRAYVEVGNVRRALAYFKRIDETGARRMYELLGDLYRDAGKSEKAIYVFRDLVGVAPGDHDVCLWQHHVAEAMMTVGTAADKLAEIGNLARLYAALAGKRALPVAELAECQALAAEMTGDLARTWHGEWAKTKDLATYELAVHAYDLYLKYLVGDAAYADTQFFRAELAWSRADYEVKNQRLAVTLWDDAAAAFAAVADAQAVDAARQVEAARATVLAAVNAALVDPRREPAPPTTRPTTAPGTLPAPQPIPAKDQKVLAAFAVYRAYVTDPEAKERIEMAVHEAALLRRYDHHAEALPLLVDVVAHHRDHPIAEDAANALLDSQNQLGREADLVATARELLADAAFLTGKDGMRRRLVAIETTHARKAAERLETAGRKTGDPAQLVACGQAYADLYNRDPDADDADELLYDAAVCFEDGKSVGLALGMYQKLEAMGERADLAVRARAVARLGVAYARVAYYGQAAKYLELYYAKYAQLRGTAGLRDGKDALGDAVIYRKGTGDDAQAIADTRLYVADPKAAAADKAEAFFSLYAVYEKQGDRDALVRHLREYIAKYAAAGGTDRLVEAYVRLGQALWLASCPRALVDGACVVTTRVRAVDAGRGKRVLKQQCAAGVAVRVLDRDERGARAAQAAFAKAVATYERATHPTPAASAWYAQARLGLLEPRYEAYLAQRFPENLDFDPAHASAAKKSMARFDGWLAQKDAAATAVKTAYQEVIALGDPAAAIAAAARVGQVAQDASEALKTAEIPAFIRPYPEAVERYCDTLDAKTEALDALTRDAYTTCLGASTKLGWFSDWSRLCERELGQLAAGEFPATTERRSAPLTPTILDLEPGATLAVVTAPASASVPAPAPAPAPPGAR